MRKFAAISTNCCPNRTVGQPANSRTDSDGFADGPEVRRWATCPAAVFQIRVRRDQEKTQRGNQNYLFEAFCDSLCGAFFCKTRARRRSTIRFPVDNLRLVLEPLRTASPLRLFVHTGGERGRPPRQRQGYRASRCKPAPKSDLLARVPG